MPASTYSWATAATYARSRAVLAAARRLLDLPDDRLVRTIVAIGHPTPAARAPKSAPGQARIPREESVTER